MDPATEAVVQLVLLFFVIFDPFVSLAVFVIATQGMDRGERNRTAIFTVAVAGILSLAVLLFGQGLLTALSTTLEDFRVAGGIILGLLGIRMVWGQSLATPGIIKKNSARAVAAIIGTPLLTGPAAITTIMISVNDFGMLITGLAVAIVLAISALMFYQANLVHRILGQATLQVISTILGMITIAWGVKFIRIGLGI
ncbi:TPA: MarC family protein [Candidatus Woesearchaeota archaeon]|nr:MarC family protein [Candidatus Woesearchaeota archaeon]HIH92339.1 MarC family protein [Candidatus Woesearchaeota archaeon]HII65880.1 MarC family protein [Candidatus Woesearchaeota archaeon]HIJ18627.1 MarC family protein [Candidatus Woesearchaeota archaeon]